MLAWSRDAEINHSNFYVNNYSTPGSKGFEALKTAVSPHAFHSSDNRVDPPKCHQNTRVDLISKILDWVSGRIDADSFMLWLHGPAGTGKSAIARTVAELCESYNLLLASFFFLRTDPKRNSMKSLVANIAYRTALVVPSARWVIESVVENDPLIFEHSIQEQFIKLVIKPLQYIGAQYRFPPLVIIDGLDECVDEGAQANLIEVLSTLGRNSLPVRFLVTSRPSPRIKYTFRSIQPPSIARHHDLNNDCHRHRDIHMFIIEKLSEIKRSHPFRSCIPAHWPSNEQVLILVRNASGQFIYAAVVMRFISSLRHQPTERLDIVLGLRRPARELPFEELDKLYRRILRRVDDLQLVLEILGLRIVLAGDVGSGQLRVIERILGLAEGHSPIALTDLHSLLECEESSGNIIIHHSSFIDFLLSERRSKDCYLEIPRSYTTVVQWILRTFRKHEPWNHQSIIPSIAINLGKHLRNARSTPGLEIDLKHFALKAFVHSCFGVLENEFMAVKWVKDTFLESLKGTERHELHRHHSGLLEQYITSCIESCPSSKKFHLLSTVWLVLRRPLKSCVTRQQLYKVHGGLGPSSIWKKLCSALFGFDPADLKWDAKNFCLLFFPTGHAELKIQANSFDPLAAFFGDRKRFRGDPPRDIADERISGIALLFINTLRRRSSRGRRTQRLLRSWARKSTRSPWLWRRRTRPILHQRALMGSLSKSASHPATHPKHWTPLFTSVTPGKGYKRRPSNVVALDEPQTEEYLTYLWTFGLLRRTLQKAPRCKEVAKALSLPLIFLPAFILFPRNSRRLVRMVRKYAIEDRTEVVRTGPSS